MRELKRIETFWGKIGGAAVMVWLSTAITSLKKIKKTPPNANLPAAQPQITPELGLRVHGGYYIIHSLG